MSHLRNCQVCEALVEPDDWEAHRADHVVDPAYTDIREETAVESIPVARSVPPTDEQLEIEARTRASLARAETFVP